MRGAGKPFEKVQGLSSSISPEAVGRGNLHQGLDF
jgi:hypothetical protein